MAEKLLRCIECNEIINCIAEKDDAIFFQNKHKGHALEELLVKENSYVSDEPYGIPARESYFETTNKKESFIIKRVMKNAQSPAVYSIVSGKIKIEKVGLELREKEIKQQMKMDKNLKKVSEFKIDRFIEGIRRLVSKLNPEEVEEMPWESNCPMLAIGKLKDNKVEEIIKLANREFSENEREDVKSFIMNQVDGDGVMTLNIKKSFQISDKT